jgi:hypothetical protein
MLAAAFALSARAAADEVTVSPSKDNTLIEDATGSLSNGQGSIFCGHTGPMAGGKTLRLVVAFNVAASVPAGSTITAASLILRLEQFSFNNTDPQTHSLYRLLADWGEGASLGGGGSGAAATANDATWAHRFYPSTSWTALGGDYVATSSASTIVGTSFVDYTWTSAQLAADVQSFLDRPACNFGWIMRGNESEPNTSRKFHSVQDLAVAVRPRLVITYTPPAAPCPEDIINNNAVDVLDLLAVINNWGACQACPAACDADVAINNAVDVLDLLAVINNWGPCS